MTTAMKPPELPNETVDEIAVHLKSPGEVANMTYISKTSVVSAERFTLHVISNH